ncbi:MAG TPA: tRNA (adenosine(37)-N6)-threonylcarbamoyltransferase complex ATPase subunit type 1 TsaE [Clostridiaceae bacterium]|nr:tRNA (adenosine(37)-N6)-threonylcarbamoyltransferase complex ATPase subunit type 1 TsaE [Clostridiaceae bacterium]
MKRIETYSVDQTIEAGRLLGSILQKGDVICLEGALGTGKTAFTSGIAKALGIDGYIKSPTFTIVNEYKGKLPLYHFDVYRISDSSEMFEVGFEEYLYGNGVVVIEWANMIKDILPEEYIRVDICKDREKGQDARIITIEFSGKRYEDRERYYESISS